jgi:hypothetical protein
MTLPSPISSKRERVINEGKEQHKIIPHENEGINQMEYLIPHFTGSKSFPARLFQQF